MYLLFTLKFHRLLNDVLYVFLNKVTHLNCSLFMFEKIWSMHVGYLVLPFDRLDSFAGTVSYTLYYQIFLFVNYVAF